MSRFRVVRLLEYTYDSAERMLDDQSHWGVGANAVMTPSHNMTIRSAVLPTELLPEEVLGYEKLYERLVQGRARTQDPSSDAWKVGALDDIIKILEAAGVKCLG